MSVIQLRSGCALFGAGLLLFAAFLMAMPARAGQEPSNYDTVDIAYLNAQHASLFIPVRDFQPNNEGFRITIPGQALGVQRAIERTNGYVVMYDESYPAEILEDCVWLRGVERRTTNAMQALTTGIARIQVYVPPQISQSVGDQRCAIFMP